ncbi:MAG: FecR domain-containing protein [Parcubacteria group bacterium]|nr:FecR domain-containing protein [Parcubacteria group bacterium]
MIRKKIAIFVFVLVVIVGFGSIGYRLLLQKEQSTIEPVLTPWIEVVILPVFVSNIDGSFKRELKTGDEVGVGAIIEVKKGGEANIYFPDGSIARIDQGTKITIDAASFDPTSKTLVVKVQLLIGRVWSKIFSLTTPESTWEVKTANAVATVRGTAFSMSSYPGKAEQLAVGRGGVAIQFLKKGAPTGDKIIVEKDKMINFTEKIVLSGIPITTLVKNQDESTRTEIEEDLKKDEVLEKKQGGFSQNSSEFRNEIIEEHVNQSIVGQENSTTTSSEIFPEFKELRILYENKYPNKEIPVNSLISFRALLVRNNQTIEDRDVTSEVKWLVQTAQNISIGTITKGGVFTAKLDENSSEQTGSGEGFITASWNDPSTGSIFRAQTSILKVIIPETPIPEGAID